MMPCDVLRSWDEQNPPKGYIVGEPPVRGITMSNAEIIEAVQLWWDTIKNDTWVDYDMRQKHEKVLERLKELLKV